MEKTYATLTNVVEEEYSAQVEITLHQASLLTHLHITIVEKLNLALHCIDAKIRSYPKKGTDHIHVGNITERYSLRKFSSSVVLL